MSDVRSPEKLLERARRLEWKREEQERRLEASNDELERIDSYLAIADGVSDALKQLNEKLLEQMLALVEEKLTIALQEVLDQPISFHTKVEFKRGTTSVQFWIERDGNEEDVYRGQGGSVANVLSVGLRMFALTNQDEREHRRFMVLDEQDCWLRPDLVPALVKIVHDAGRALGFQVIMISHHDVSVFERYADKIYRFIPIAEGAVRVIEATVDGSEAPADEPTIT
ncbi:MAG: hypothetical protein ACLFP4_01610 [Spirochaetales bacterium]